jgi:hypothetical protein
MVALSVISATQEVEVRGLRSQASWGQKHNTLSEKQIKNKRAGNAAQVVRYMSNKWEVLSTNTSIAKIKK